jgi:hypothetical protein
MAFESSVTQVTIGPDSAYQLRWRDTQGGQIPTFAARNFSIADATICEFTSDWQVNSVASRSRAEWGIYRSILGNGPVVAIDLISGSWRLSIGTCGTWAQYGSMATTSAAIGGLAANTWFRMHIKAVANSDGSTTVTARVLTTADVELATLTSTLSVTRGDYCGFHSTFDQLGAASTASFTAIRVQASGSTGFVPENVATSYLWTFVNDVGEESGPSPPSETVLRPDGVSVTVTTPTGIPTGVSTDYGITTKRIYRSVTSNAGTIFSFVAEIPLSQEDYTDALSDAQLGEALESEGWALPPDDLRNILALPNGIMVGSSGNQLCFSARNRPHAWPPAFRLVTDTDIVGLGAIDTTVVVGTQSYPYIASGNDPSAFSMSKIEIRQACVSRRSFASVSEIGVIFASPDGLISVAGTGLLRILTVDIFTREQWQQLRPETITALAHDDTYWFFFQGDPGSGFASGDVSRGGYALDMSPTGFGLVALAFYAEAIYADPQTDNFYLALSEDDEPTDPLLPVPSSAPADVDGSVVYQFDADPGSKMVAKWGSRLFMLRRPGCMQYVQVRARSYANMVARFYKDENVLFYTTQVTSGEPFVIPTDNEYDQFWVEILTTDRVYEIQAAERIEEFQ